MSSSFEGITAADLERLNDTGAHRLLAGHLIDGSGGPVRSRQIIEIDGGRIVSVKPAPAAGQDPPNLLDLSQYSILPALLDAHVHLALSATPDAPASQATPQTVPDLKEVITRRCQLYLANGVVAMRDACDRQGAVLAAKQSGPLPIHVAAAGYAWHAAGR